MIYNSQRITNESRLTRFIMGTESLTVVISEIYRSRNILNSADKVSWILLLLTIANIFLMFHD